MPPWEGLILIDAFFLFTNRLLAGPKSSRTRSTVLLGAVDLVQIQSAVYVVFSSRRYSPISASWWVTVNQMRLATCL